MNFTFRILPVPMASTEEIAIATKIVNDANAVFMRIFPGKRLDNYPLQDVYKDYDLVLTQVDDTIVATMTLLGTEQGLKVELLAVDPLAHGKGIGPNMLEIARQEAQRKGLSSVWLEVVNQGSLVEFYLRNSFQIIKRMNMPTGYWESTEPFELVTMSRNVEYESPFESEEGLVGNKS